MKLLDRAAGWPLLRQRWLAWTAAAGVATGLHVTAAMLAFYPFEAPEADDPLAGSLVIELSPMLTFSMVEAASAPLGPLSSEQAASQPKFASQEVVAAPDQPVVPAAHVDADLAFPRVEPGTKPKEQAAEAPSPATTADAAVMAAASQAMSPPKVDAPKAATPAAPEVGISPQALRAKATWNKSIGVHLERFKRYPQSARATSATGQVVVEFTMGRDGNVNNAKVVRSSGSAVLDDAAIDMVTRASPLPSAPKDIAGVSFTMAVPVVFKMP